LILSHHGEHEFGSPVLPMTVESMALHHLDNLDAKLYAFAEAVSAESEGEGNWTAMNRMLKRRLYRG
jgi:3'-5' exoribonuclease